MGRGCEFLWDRRFGVSKDNSRSGLVCVLGEVLDLCEKSSGEVALVLFDFCDNVPWDVATEFLFWGVMISKRLAIGS